MKKVLLTGGTGFVGRSLLPFLRDRYEVSAPVREQCDMNDTDATDAFLAQHHADILIHCAVTSPDNKKDAGLDVLACTLRSFRTIERHAADFEKIIYIGSGAEFDKSRDITAVTEEDFGKHVPADAYGLAKYTLNKAARASQNIYNARLFGCYGPTEPERRFIRHAIDCCLRNEPITIRRDCLFSYVFVDDLARAVMLLAESRLCFHDYNICGDSVFLLSELAQIVKRQMHSDVPVVLLSSEKGKDYTGVNARFKTAFPDFAFTDIETGVAREIAWQKSL